MQLITLCGCRSGGFLTLKGQGETKLCIFYTVQMEVAPVICVQSNQLDALLSSVYRVTTPVHVSVLLVAHHQEVTMYVCDSWYVLYVLFDCRQSGRQSADSRLYRSGNSIKCGQMVHQVGFIAHIF
jgi:hypothetical protein